MNKIILGLGTNLGDRFKNIELAYQLIEEKIGAITAKSKLYETAPWGVLDQPDFINSCISIESNLTPKECLKMISEIENEMGRIRYQKWGARLIDIDILFFGNEIINQEELSVPHPFIQERIFVIKPLEDIIETYIHPVLKESIKALSLKCTDNTAFKVL